MTESKIVPVGDVISTVTGRVLSRDGIGGIYNVCDFMTGEPNFTHQLPRVSEECRPVIVSQHPWLGDIVTPPEWDESDFSITEEIVLKWLDGIEAEYGETVELTPLDPIDHTSIDPITELKMMNQDAVVIAVELPDAEA